MILDAVCASRDRVAVPYRGGHVISLLFSKESKTVPLHTHFRPAVYTYTYKYVLRAVAFTYSQLKWYVQFLLLTGLILTGLIHSSYLQLLLLTVKYYTIIYNTIQYKWVSVGYGYGIDGVWIGYSEI